MINVTIARRTRNSSSGKSDNPNFSANPNLLAIWLKKSVVEIKAAIPKIDK